MKKLNIKSEAAVPAHDQVSSFVKLQSQLWLLGLICTLIGHLN